MNIKRSVNRKIRRLIKDALDVKICPICQCEVTENDFERHVTTCICAEEIIKINESIYSDCSKLYSKKDIDQLITNTIKVAYLYEKIKKNISDSDCFTVNIC